MGRLYLVVPAQRFLLDDDLGIEEAEELSEAGDVDYEYDHIISDIMSGGIETEFEYEEN